MSGIALAIVLVAAFLHACWNFLAKKSHNKIVFIWWFLLIATIVYSPMFLYLYSSAAISLFGWGCIIATGVIHALYFWFVGGAYERGDLSLVYPLSRGSGPLFVPILAVVLLDEKLSMMGMAGIALVIFGIYSIHLQSFSIHSYLAPLRTAPKSASLWAFTTGLTIAAYSLVDKIGVQVVFPPVYIYLMFAISLLLLSPIVVLRHTAAIKTEWRANKVFILINGVLVLATYLMILFAFQISKVSYVVAAREVSIVFSAFFGIFALREKNACQKIIGSALIAMGVVIIGFSK
jgi:drug/metabolite transporter (DMT)-like permease